MIVFFDSNILIDALRGHAQARQEMLLHETANISIISWIEVMAGAESHEQADIRSYLSRFPVKLLDEPIAQEAANLRRAYRLKLPDAIIWATARKSNALLVTRDARAFPENDPFIRIPYTLP